MCGLKSKQRVKSKGNLDMNNAEEIEVERHCGNCVYYEPSTCETQKGFGECAYPIPEWLLTMFYRSRLVSLSFGHDCACHKLKPFTSKTA